MLKIYLELQIMKDVKFSMETWSFRAFVMWNIVVL